MPSPGHLPKSDKADVLGEALAAAGRIGNEFNRALTLSALAEHLSADLLADALAAASVRFGE